MDKSKNIILLTNNEHKKFDFLVELGQERGPTTSPYMCMSYSLYTIFLYQKFNIMVSDDKLIDYTTSRDGIIILVDTVNEQITRNVSNILNKNITKPILIILQANYNHNNQLEKLVKSSMHRYYYLPDTKFLTDDSNGIEAKTWFNSMLKKSQPIPKPKLTSVNIPIKEMADKFVKCTLPLEMWDHYGRLRIVYYSLKTFGIADTISPDGWLCTNWRKYKTSIGHGNLWHYTLTRFWAEIIYILMPKYPNFRELYNDNPDIQNGSLHQKYYTADVLFNANARIQWVEPNLKTLKTLAIKK